jgi:hypothetical protein
MIGAGHILSDGSSPAMAEVADSSRKDSSAAFESNRRVLILDSLG